MTNLYQSVIDRRESAVRNNTAAIIVSLILTAGSYAIGLHYEWIKDVSMLEAFAVFTSYWCTFLCVIQTRFNYIIGAVSVAALGLLFYNQNLLSSMALQIYLFPTLIYGWWRWQSDLDPRPVSRVKTDVSLLFYLAAIAVSYLVGLYINRSFGGSNSLTDTSIFVFSVLAQLMLDNKKLENWIVWFLVDVVSVILYWSQDLKILSIQMGLFGINALWGYYEWHKTMVRNEISKTKPLVLDTEGVLE